MKSLAGVFAPITTPFNPDGSLNLEQLRENTSRYAGSGLSGYLILGSNGENKSLDHQEKRRIIQTIVCNKNPAQAAMVGSIFESTRETIEFALEAEELGADFITLLPPSYFRSQMKDDVLIRYFTDVASAVHVPCLLYKAPQFAGGVDVSVAVLTQCARHPNIAGIKDSSSGQIDQVLHAAPEGFQVMSGSANSFLGALFNGAAGGVISLANIFPEIVVELYHDFREGKLQEAIALNRQIIAVNLEISGRFGVAGVKYAMDQSGYHGGDPRLPLLPLNAEGRQSIDKCLVRYLADWMDRSLKNRSERV